MCLSIPPQNSPKVQTSITRKLIHYFTLWLCIFAKKKTQNTKATCKGQYVFLQKHN